MQLLQLEMNNPQLLDRLLCCRQFGVCYSSDSLASCWWCTRVTDRRTDRWAIVDYILRSTCCRAPWKQRRDGRIDSRS